ncbi:hypothetical protein OF83DRAFT_1126254 [Amylostereum chailletii]|nr:hypothetical protein OF83DRAFT_1126254 [Amylostereum chailletii]
MKTPATVTFGATGIAYALGTLVALGADEADKDEKTKTWMDRLFPAWRGTLPVALSGALAFDLAGLVFGWRRFDHAAHVGGALFGACYHAYGFAIWDACYRGWWDSVYGEVADDWVRRVRSEREGKARKEEARKEEAMTKGTGESGS